MFRGGRCFAFGTAPEVCPRDVANDNARVETLSWVRHHTNSMRFGGVLRVTPSAKVMKRERDYCGQRSSDARLRASDSPMNMSCRTLIVRPNDRFGRNGDVRRDRFLRLVFARGVSRFYGCGA
jgi:hypothetical protein